MSTSACRLFDLGTSEDFFGVGVRLFEERFGVRARFVGRGGVEIFGCTLAEVLCRFGEVTLYFFEIDGSSVVMSVGVVGTSF